MDICSLISWPVPFSCHNQCKIPQTLRHSTCNSCSESWQNACSLLWPEMIWKLKVEIKQRVFNKVFLTLFVDLNNTVELKKTSQILLRSSCFIWSKICFKGLLQASPRCKLRKIWLNAWRGPVASNARFDELTQTLYCSSSCYRFLLFFFICHISYPVALPKSW